MPKPHSGRAKDQTKADAITRAARTLFMAKGFDGVSVDAIANEAGVSKVTVYSHFRNKEELFRSVVSAIAQEHPVADLPEISSGTDFRAALESHGLRLISILSKPELHDFHRVMLSNPRRMKQVMRIVYHNGPERVLGDLQELLERGKRAGHHTAPDCRRTADQLLSMWKGMAHVRQEMGVSGPRKKADALADVCECIDLVLRAWPPAQGAALATRRKRRNLSP